MRVRGVLPIMVALCLASLANGAVKFAIGPLDWWFAPGYTVYTDVVASDETENFTVYVDFNKLYNGFNLDLWDCRTSQIVESLRVTYTAWVYAPTFTVNEPALGPAAGDLGSFVGPYAIEDGYRIEFIRLQSVGFAPNGVIATVSLTFVPEPATLALLAGGAAFLRRRCS